MGTFIVNYTDEQLKAFDANVDIEAQDWIQHAWDDKARRCIDRIVTAASDKQPNKMTDDEKNEVIKGLSFESKSPERQFKDIAGRIIKREA